jgi:hypothetical protein
MIETLANATLFAIVAFPAAGLLIQILNQTKNQK